MEQLICDSRRDGDAPLFLDYLLHHRFSACVCVYVCVSLCVCPFVDLLFLVSYFLLLETVEEAFHFFSFWLSVKRLTDLGWWWL